MPPTSMWAVAGIPNAPYLPSADERQESRLQIRGRTYEPFYASPTMTRGASYPLLPLANWPFKSANRRPGLGVSSDG